MAIRTAGIMTRTKATSNEIEPSQLRKLVGAISLPLDRCIGYFFRSAGITIPTARTQEAARTRFQRRVFTSFLDQVFGFLTGDFIVRQPPRRTDHELELVLRDTARFLAQSPCDIRQSPPDNR